MDHNVIGNGEREGLKTHGIGQSASKSSGTYLIYRLTNTVNGKAYVGITGRTLGIRWSEHVERARQGLRNSRIYDAIRKYGPDAFVREVIAVAETEDGARALEIEHIAKNDSYESGYNSNLGGEGFLVFPEHIRRKISEAQKGKIISAECRRKMSEAKIGRSECAEHFGDHTKKGAENPRARSFRFRLPDGSERVIQGLRAFCRDNGLHLAHVNARGHSKGYVLLERFND